MSGRILMPVLPSREQGRVSRWLVAEGQAIAPGDVIAEVETAGCTLEIEASGEGRIERILIGAGSGPLAAGTPLALLSAIPAAESPAASPSSAVSPGAPSSVPPVQVSTSDLPLGRAVTMPEAPSPMVAPSAVRNISYREGLRDALAEEMRRDDRVFVIGVDVGQNRGAPEVTQGLLDEFGPRRVVSVPQLETATASLAMGAAYAGLKPVVCLSSWAAALPALPSLAEVAAAVPYLSREALSVPIVLRGPLDDQSRALAGPGVAAWLSHVPGLKVVSAATSGSGKALLKAAIRNGGPVAFLEHEDLYNVAGPVSDDPDIVAALGRAEVVRSGADVTIVAHGGAVSSSLHAADVLALDGIAAEVIDLRWLRPLDLETVWSSLADTGRLVVVEETWPYGSPGAELIASTASSAFQLLKTAPKRLAGADLPSGFSDTFVSSRKAEASDIVAAVRAMMGGG